MRIAINIANRDRPTELALLLQSLRTQTNQEWDIFLFNDNSGTPLTTYHFLNCLFARLKQEDHRVFIENAEFNHGVSRAREELVKKSLSSIEDYDYILRIDDDVILEPDFIERLLRVIGEGYDIASGVTPPLVPIFKRNSDMVKIANEVVMDGEKTLFDGDDCGILYTESKIVPAHHFRSSALMKKEVHKQVKYYPTRLTKHGFREETLFSFRAQMKGFKIGVDLGAIAWHLNTPSGGERFAESQQMIEFNKKVLDEFIQENQAELNKLFPKREISDLERMKETNLRR